MASQPLPGVATAAVRGPGSLAAALPRSTPTLGERSGALRASAQSRAAVVPLSVPSRTVDRRCSQPAAHLPETGVTIAITKKGRLGHAPASRRRRGPLPARAGSENGTSVKSKESTSEHARLGTPTVAPAKAAPEDRPEASGNPSEGESSGEGEDSTSLAVGQGSAVLGVLVVAAIAAVGTVGVLYKDEINGAIAFFSNYIEGTPLFSLSLACWSLCCAWIQCGQEPLRRCVHDSHRTSNCWHDSCTPLPQRGSKRGSNG